MLNNSMMNYDPPGYTFCKIGFDIYTRGGANVLVDCLSQIGVQPASACDVNQVSKCIGEVSKAVCPSENGAATCAQPTVHQCGEHRPWLVLDAGYGHKREPHAVRVLEREHGLPEAFLD